MRGRGRWRGRGRGRGRGRWGKRTETMPNQAMEEALTVRIGDKVEVRSDEEGFVGAWYAAEVVHIESPSSCIVEYDQLVSDQDLPLQEVVALDHLRPVPPPLAPRSCWLCGDFVEAYDRDGWWSGVVTRSVPDVITVHFRVTGEEIDFHPSMLRGLQNWENGQWTDLTQVRRPEEYHCPDAAVVNASASPLVNKKRAGRPKKGKDCPSSALPLSLQGGVDEEMGIEQPAEALQFKRHRNGNEVSHPQEVQVQGTAEPMSTMHDERCSHRPALPRRKLRLGLVAYQLLVEALHSKGPLDWQQERLLADVRLQLDITNTEQAYVLKGFTPPNKIRKVLQ